MLGEIRYSPLSWNASQGKRHPWDLNEEGR